MTTMSEDEAAALRRRMAEQFLAEKRLMVEQREAAVEREVQAIGQLKAEIAQMEAAMLDLSDVPE